MAQTRTARFIEASSTLRRRIWASLPWHVRLAEFFTRLAVSSADAFGRAIYAEFLTHGIVNMPDINGQPASTFSGAPRSLANRLPPGYGREFGKKAYGMLINKFHNPTLVEDVLSSFMLRFMEKGAANLRAGASRQEAEHYVMQGLTRQALNAIRDKGKEVSDVYFSGDGEEQKHDLVIFDEDSAQRQLARMLPKIKHKLEAIHPDAPLYVKLSVIDGYTDREIIGDPEHGVPSMLPNPVTKTGKPLTQRNWDMSYKDPIFAVLKKSFADLHQPSV